MKSWIVDTKQTPHAHRNARSEQSKCNDVRQVDIVTSVTRCLGSTAGQVAVITLGLCVIHLRLALPALMLAAGVSCWDDCAVDDLIPLWLQIGGAVLLLRYPLDLARCRIFMHRDDAEDAKTEAVEPSQQRKEMSALEWIIQLLHMLLELWCIFGCILVFSAMNRVQFQDASQSNYCNHYAFTVARTLAVLGSVYFAVSLAIFVAVYRSAKCHVFRDCLFLF